MTLQASPREAMYILMFVIADTSNNTDKNNPEQ